MSKRLKIFAVIIIVLDVLTAFTHGFIEPSKTMCFTAALSAMLGGFLAGKLL